MQTASLDLCRQLFDLSGWGETHYCHRQTPEGFKVISCFFAVPPASDILAPAYDLGYMLRKLPPQIGGDDKWLSIEPIALDRWSACYRVGTAYPAVDQWGDTPEDAACKLAIELFKQGILKRENV